jgi:RalA-binding protein 1
VLLAIHDHETNAELWRVSKDHTSLLHIDTCIKLHFQGHVTKFPERSLFHSSSPTKINARNEQLRQYFSWLIGGLSLPLDSRQHLCQFLSTDVDHSTAERNSGESKEGFLMERGKNFGGWKIRYFILEGPFLNCGEHSHSLANRRISLFRSKIIKADDSDDDYRHAFYILENEAKGNLSGTYSKHVLSAETDKDRDEWIEMLQKFVDVQSFCELKPEEASYRK